MFLLADWGDKDTIHALSGVLIAGLPAIGWLIVRVWRQKTASDEVAADIEDRSETRTFGQMKQVLDDTVVRNKELQSELLDRDRKIDKLRTDHDKKIDELRHDHDKRIDACERDRYELRGKVAAQAESISWMKQILKDNGLISDDDSKDEPNGPTGRHSTPAGIRIPKMRQQKPPNPPQPPPVG